MSNIFCLLNLRENTIEKIAPFNLMTKEMAQKIRELVPEKEFSIPFVAEGFYCIDLFDEKNQNILQTTTITPQAYRNLTEGKQK